MCTIKYPDHTSNKSKLMPTSPATSLYPSHYYLLMSLFNMSTVFSSGHSNKTNWLSCMSRKGCKDNRMCPGSAVKGRRIQGSYCTLWNELRNARCLPFLGGSGLYHMQEANDFDDNGTIVWYMCDFVLAHGRLLSPTYTFSSDILKVLLMKLNPHAGHGCRQQQRWVESLKPENIHGK